MTFLIPIFTLAMFAMLVTMPNASAHISPDPCTAGSAAAVAPSLIKAKVGDVITYDVRYDAAVGVCDFTVESGIFTFPDGSTAAVPNTPFLVVSGSSSVTQSIPGSYTAQAIDIVAGFWTGGVVSPTTSHALGHPPGSADQVGNTLVFSPSISVDKAPHAKVAAGTTLQVSALVTNTGNVLLNPVGATDTKAGALSCVATSLAPGASTTCTGSFVANANGSNTVTATGTHQDGQATATDTEVFVVQNPDIDVTKTCSVTGSDEITWIVTVTNTGDVSLAVIATDTRHGALFAGNLAPAATAPIAPIVEGGLAAGTYVDTASAVGTHQLGTVDGSSTITCTIEGGGSEGLTPGFWKANAENWDAGAWIEDPTEKFNSVFGTNVDLKLAKGNADTPKGESDDPTLYGALGARGGGENALARHCVAAKLNAEEGHIDYPMSRAAVIADCAEALNNGTPEEINTLKDLLDLQNNLGADIDQHHQGSP